MAPTPSKPNINHTTQFKTPNSKHRINFNNNPKTPSTNPNTPSHPKDTHNQEHPVEVIARLRNNQQPISYFLQVNSSTQNIRIRADIGYRDFSLDGVSLSEDQDLDAFYKMYVQSRITGVKMGNNCTIMMYGPTGSGKSYTMFGCAKESGIVYRALKDILGEEEAQVNLEKPMFVQVTILEIYNEDIYDLLSSNGGGGLGFGWPKGGSGSKAKLEVMGKKAKNASFLYGTEAGKISKEIQKVEKRRIVKSTHCNDRSSRSHCMIILDVPTVGGRLMLVDMAGSENIEQAGQTGFEAKMQTAKINQGNIALKRVVESIANGDSHVPFRDSKLTMLLQDSFEDDKSKILMILCANPDSKEIHKTICTLEYGAKAKCIVRGPHTPVKDKIGTEDSSTVVLGSRIAAMDQFINKLQMENKLKEKERNEAQQLLLKKEEEVSALRAKLEGMNGDVSGASEEQINLKVNERTQLLKLELEKKLEECKRMAEQFVGMERKRMEERILQQQEEVEVLRRRLEEIEVDLYRSKHGNGEVCKSSDLDRISKRLMRMYGDEDPGMVKSMDLDMDDQEPPIIHDDTATNLFSKSSISGSLGYPQLNALSTVYEEDEVEVEEEEEEQKEVEDEEVKKEIIQEKRVCTSQDINTSSPGVRISSILSSPENPEDVASSRQVRIQNIFTLCGNHRELSHHVRSSPLIKVDEAEADMKKSASKENYNPSSGNDGQIEVILEDFTGALLKDKENQQQSYKQPAKASQAADHVPLSPLSLNQLNNKLPLTPLSNCLQPGDILSPSTAPHLSSSTPFVTRL